jgi:hypothetical protein
MSAETLIIEQEQQDCSVVRGRRCTTSLERHRIQYVATFFLTATVVIDEHRKVPFDFAQGRLSLARLWRTSSG